MATTSQPDRNLSPTPAVERATGAPARPTGNTSKRGFASMNPEQQRLIASQGGKASHASGRGHQWTSAEAREAGRKGGQKSTRRPASKKP